MDRSTDSRRARNSASLRIGTRRRPASRPSRRRCRLASRRVEPRTLCTPSPSVSSDRSRGVRTLTTVFGGSDSSSAAASVEASSPDPRRRRRRRRRREAPASSDSSAPSASSSAPAVSSASSVSSVSSPSRSSPSVSSSSLRALALAAAPAAPASTAPAPLAAGAALSRLVVRAVVQAVVQLGSDLVARPVDRLVDRRLRRVDRLCGGVRNRRSGRALGARTAAAAASRLRRRGRLVRDRFGLGPTARAPGGWLEHRCRRSEQRRERGGRRLVWATAGAR